MNKIGREGGGEHVYVVRQLSTMIGERESARENTRRGASQRKRESASVQESEHVCARECKKNERKGTCTRVDKGERRSERQSEIFVLANRVHDTTVSEREKCSY